MGGGWRESTLLLGDIIYFELLREYIRTVRDITYYMWSEADLKGSDGVPLAGGRVLLSDCIFRVG